MTSNRNTEIGARVRQHRKSKGFTLQALCASLPKEESISFQQFANYENGASRWPAVLLSDVSDLLNVDIRSLLGKI